MSKAVFLSIPTTGHVNPSLPVTKELVRRGENIVYYLTESYRRKIEATGAEFRSYPPEIVNDDYFDSLDGSNPPLTMATMIQTCHAILPWLKEVIQEEQPDYILHDSMCPWGWQIANYYKIPSVSSMSLLVLTPQIMLRGGALPTLATSLLTGIPNILRFRRTSAQIAKDYGVTTPSVADYLNCHGTISLNYTSDMFQPSADSLDDTIKFVGPSIEQRPHDEDFPFEELKGAPLVYISLGTVINRNIDFFQRCLQAFGDTKYQIVMSIGRNINPEALGEIPGNCIVRPYVPQLEILERASLFITHAGMNSVQEGLYYNVPLILVPQQLEQTFVANRVAELGAGIHLKDKQRGTETIQATAEKILNDASYRKNASKIGESLRSAGGYTRAADEVFAMKEEHIPANHK